MAEFSRDIYYGTQYVPLQQHDVSLEQVSTTRNIPLFSLESAVNLDLVRVHDTALVHMPDFPFANDSDSAMHYASLKIREKTPGYKKVEHPVALIVGEGSIAAALPYIPEPTVLLIDIDPKHTRHMQRYITALRLCATRDEFFEDIGFKDDCFRVQRQVKNWEKYGFEHPFKSDQAFKRASQAARGKSFVIKTSSLTDIKDTQQLASMLDENDCTITFINLTNVAPYCATIDSAQTLYKSLACLPVLEDAPIMTTSNRFTFFPADPDEGLMIQTGPFWGLEDLRDNGDIISGLNHEEITRVGYEADRKGALFTRQLLAQAQIEFPVSALS